MAGSFKLAVGGTNITLSALSASGPTLNRDLGEVVHKTMTGKIYIYQKSDKIDHQLMINNVSKANADYINGWKASGTTVVYTPDTDNAGTTFNVKIINTETPLSWMADTPPDSLFAGTIMLREI